MDIVDPAPDIFLCHSKTDVEWVHSFAERIEDEKWRDRQLRVGFDDWDIRPGQNPILRLSELLQRSRFVGVVLSPELTTSEFCAFEWTSAVYNDPAGAKGRVIPILLRMVDRGGTQPLEIPWALRFRNWLDFSKKENFYREFQRLLCVLRDEPLPRGRPARRRPMSGAAPVVTGLPAQQFEADPVEEVLLSNLLPVVHFPTTIWSAASTARNPAEVVQALGSTEAGKDFPQFILREGRIFLFSDLSAGRVKIPVNVSLTDLRRHAAGDWLRDADRWRWYVDLLHKSLGTWARRLGLVHERRKGREDRYFFPPAGEGGVNDQDRKREFAGSVRTVAKRCVRPGGAAFWVHQACRLRFETLGDRLFLRVTPAWVFTNDGRQPIDGPNVGPLSMAWGGKERNGAILRHVLFWGRVLCGRRHRIEIPAGDDAIVIRPQPTRTLSSVGVAYDRTHIRALIEPIGDEFEVAEAVLDGDVVDRDEESESHAP